MRNLNTLNGFRMWNEEVREIYGWAGDETCGVFLVPLAGRQLLCVASANHGWDHVSVSLPDRCPSWAQMDHVKRLFFEDGEVAMQLHVTGKNKVNVHDFCLHLWRQHGEPMALPPVRFV